MQNNYLKDKEFKGKGALWPFLKRIFGYSFRYKSTNYGFIFAAILVALTDAIWPVIWMYYLDLVIVPLVNEYQTFKQQGFGSQVKYKKMYCTI